MNARKALLAAASAFLLGSAHAQVAMRTLDLSAQKPDWQSVIGGEAIAPAVETSYGIAVLTDGRMLSSCTSKGNVIWKKGVNGRPSKYFTERDDFLYVVTNDKKITLVNQSGTNLWTASNSFRITENPVIGHDGRIFVHGQSALACFGINGTRKWQVETGKIADMPTCLLNDGSVVIFMADTKDGKTTGKRFSQFGEEMEDLIFSSVVQTAVSCEQGILVALQNGSIGLCNVVNGLADSPWIQKSYIPSGAFAICYSKASGNAAFFFSTGGNTTAIILRTSNGEFLNQFALKSFSPGEIQLAKQTDAGFFIADSSTACEFAEDGTIIWEAALPQKSQWDFLYYTRSNHLILCMKDWSLKSFHTMQTTKAVYKDFWDDTYSSDIGEAEKPDTPEDAIKKQEITQSDRILGIRMFSDEKLAETQKALKAGDYGRKEREFLVGIQSELASYKESFYQKNPSQSYFARNPIYTQKLLAMMAQIGCSGFSTDFATLIRYERDPQLLSALVYASGQQMFDPDGEILTSYEIAIRSPQLQKNTALLKNVCDATFSICKYMGRPALINHGKEILRQLGSPVYDTAVREYASKTFERFASIEM